MEIETTRNLGPKERVWIGNRLKAINARTFDQFRRWVDNTGHPHVTFQRTDTGSETYSPKHILIEVEHNPEKPFKDYPYRYHPRHFKRLSVPLKISTS